MKRTLSIKGRIVIFLIVLAGFQIAISVYILPGILWSLVYINGQETRVATNSSLGEIMKSRGFDPSPGDLVDVEGKVIKSGGGQPSQVLLNGQKAAAGTKIKNGDSIFLARGQEVVEGITQDYALFLTPRKTTGLRKAKPQPESERRFMRVITKGALSGKIIEQSDVAPPLIYGKKNLHIKPNAIALCFDDGPDPKYTPQIIEILQRKRAPATFFVLGSAAERFPDIIKMQSNAGFEIGNHTYSHKPVTKISLAQLDQEIARTDEVLLRLTGKKPVWFRPPQLLYNEQAVKIIEAHGYNIVLGSIDPSDYLKPPVAKIIDTAVRQASTGSIVVMHDGGGDRSRTVEALPSLIDELRVKGYEFVSIEGLFTD